MTNQEKFCTECGTKNPIENQFCLECGHEFTSNDITAETNVTSATKEHKEKAGSISKIKQYILSNKKLALIVAAVAIVIIGLVIFFTGSTAAQGQWQSSEEDFYYSRERYTVDIKKNGNAVVVMESSDPLNGTMTLKLSVDEDTVESKDTRKVYTLNSVEMLEMVVPTLTYQYSRSDILSQFSDSEMPYEVNEGSDDVSVVFDFENHSEELFYGDFPIVFELVDQNDVENEYREDYLIFDGFDGTVELFNR